MKSDTQPCLTNAIDTRPAADSAGQRLTVQTRKPNKFLDRFEAREAAARERDRLENIEHLARMEGWGDKHGVCYFMRGDDGLIKIGYTRDLWQRLSAVRYEAKVGVTLLAVAAGGRSRESHYHRLYKEHRVYGEWFNPALEIEAEAARLAATDFHAQQTADDTPIAHLTTIAQVTA